MPEAATITHSVSHAAPPGLTPGPGSPDVLIAQLPAWRGMPECAVESLRQLKAQSDEQIRLAEQASQAASGSPGFAAAQALENGVKAAALASMSAAINSASSGADIHLCTTPLPNPPHGPGVVIDGSSSVLINNLPAARRGDQLLEALGPPNRITCGEESVEIGD